MLYRNIQNSGYPLCISKNQRIVTTTKEVYQVAQLRLQNKKKEFLWCLGFKVYLRFFVNIIF